MKSLNNFSFLQNQLDKSQQNMPVTESGGPEKVFGVFCVVVGVLVFFAKPPNGKAQVPLRRRLEFLFFMTTFAMFLWEVPMAVKAYGFGLFALWDLLRVECINTKPITTFSKVGQIFLHIFLLALLGLGAYCVLGDVGFPKASPITTRGA